MATQRSAKQMRSTMSLMHRNMSMNNYFKSVFYFSLITYVQIPIFCLGQSNSLEPSYATGAKDVEELYLNQEVTLEELLEYALRKNFAIHSAQQSVTEHS